MPEKIEMTVWTYGEWEAFVQAHYNWPLYNFVADVECGNDSEHLYYAKRDEEPDGYHQRFEVQRIANHEHYITSALFVDLANKGLIEEGQHLIKVMW